MKKTLIFGLALVMLAPLLVSAQPCLIDEGVRGRGCFDHARDRFFEQQGRGGHRGTGAGFGHLLAIGEEIDLTDQQREKLFEMMTEAKLQSIDLRAKIQKAQLELSVLKRQDDSAEPDVMQAIDQVARMKAEMQKLRYQHHQQSKALLTAEQLDKLKKLQMQRPKEGRGFEQKGRHGGRG